MLTNLVESTSEQCSINFVWKNARAALFAFVFIIDGRTTSHPLSVNNRRVIFYITFFMIGIFLFAISLQCIPSSVAGHLQKLA